MTSAASRRILSVAHSIPDAFGLPTHASRSRAPKTSDRSHAGDVEPTDFSASRDGQEGGGCLSTPRTRMKAGRAALETMVGDALEQILLTARVSDHVHFASQIARIQHIIDAQKNRTRGVCTGRSMEKNIHVGDLGMCAR